MRATILALSLAVLAFVGLAECRGQEHPAPITGDDVWRTQEIDSQSNRVRVESERNGYFMLASCAFALFAASHAVRTGIVVQEHVRDKKTSLGSE